MLENGNEIELDSYEEIIELLVKDERVLCFGAAMEYYLDQRIIIMGVR